jgi:FdhE protein
MPSANPDMPAGASSTGRHVGSGKLPPVDPAWQPYLRLLELALGEAEDVAWEAMVPDLGERPQGAPLVHGTTVHLHAARVRVHQQRLSEAIGLGNVAAVDSVELVRSVITRDDGLQARLAGEAAMAVDTIAVLGQLVALPLLHACARVWAAEVPQSWRAGWCPVCGAWASIAEVRGIARDRRLRCGCCASDWSFSVLRCAFCEEGDHRRLGSLVSEGEEQHRRIETCDSCRGYLKVVTTLAALPAHLLALHDVATVPLDLIAQERGYARPERFGWVPNVVVVG